MAGHQLVIDIQTIQSRSFSERGIPRYTIDLSRALLRAGAPISALALNPALPFPQRLHPELARAPQLCWNTARNFRRLSEKGPVAYHIMSPLEGPRPVQSTLPPYALGHGVPLVCTLYDLIPEIFKVFPKGSSFERLYLLRRELMRRSDLLLAISEGTRRDALELFELDPERIVAIGTGASEYFRPPHPEERPEELLAAHVRGLNRPFVSAVTGVFGLDKRKNTEGLIDAFGLLPADVRKEYQVVVTCKLTPQDRAIWLARAESKGFAPGQLVMTDYVPDAVLRALYQCTALFVYPSVYEGFGLPALEAARCGAPTITSNTSAMPEILDFEPATFDPVNPDELAVLMERALTDTSFRAELRRVADAASAKHTWERVAQKTVAAYDRLDPPKRRRPPAPARVALVGPFPPVRSDLATYDARLAERLGTMCDLECIFEGPHDRDKGPERPDRAGDAGAHSPRAFSTGVVGQFVSPASYDSMFYVLGNNSDHHATYDLALRFPGIVWLHDVDLANMYITMAQKALEPGAARDYLAGTLRNQYRDRSPEQLTDIATWSSPALYRDAGARLTGEAVMRSRAVIVGSEAARSVLELDVGPLGRLPKTWVVPVGIPEPPAGPGDGGLRAADSELIVSMGSVTPAVRPEVLLDAVAMLARDRPVRLALVGPVERDYRADLIRQAEKLGIADRVDLPGYVAFEGTWDWLQVAACVVQVQDHGGRPSFSSTEAIAAGIPLITSARSETGLPTESVIDVAPDVTAGTLATEIRSLLVDGERRGRLLRAAQEYAKSWTFDQVAESLLEIVRWDAARPDH